MLAILGIRYFFRRFSEARPPASRGPKPQGFQLQESQAPWLKLHQRKIGQPNKNLLSYVNCVDCC